MVFEERKDNFVISTDRSKLDIEMIHNYLANESYWSKGIPLDLVKKAIENSECFGVYDNGKQVGFARAVTDFSTFGYLADVFILSEYRGRGLSKWLMECITMHPELRGFRRWILITRDAHKLYERFGYTPVKKPQNYMENHDPDVYS